jgi:predicted amidophosphoribosyltransferase
MSDKTNQEKKVRFCPFCEEEIAEAAFPYCEACGLSALRCPKCGMAIPRNQEKCPHCGADLREEAAKGL